MQVYYLFSTKIKSILKAPAEKHPPEFHNRILGAWICWRSDRKEPPWTAEGLLLWYIFGEIHDKDTRPINIVLSIRYHIDETGAFKVKKKKINLTTKKVIMMKSSIFFVYIFSLGWIVFSYLIVSLWFLIILQLSPIHPPFSHNAMILPLATGCCTCSITQIASIFLDNYLSTTQPSLN